MQDQLNAILEFEDLLFSRLYETNEALANSRLLPQTFSPGSDAAKLRISLIGEEAYELTAALSSEDLHQVIKETCDLLYVIFGTAVTFGFEDVLEEAFERVHENNMNKMTNATFREDGKIIKAKNHPKVDLVDLVNHVQGVTE